MANIKAAKKAIRVSLRRQAINKNTYSKSKTLAKEATALVAKKSADALEQVKLAQKALDKAVKSKVIHKNKAARLKSRLMKKLIKSKTKS